MKALEKKKKKKILVKNIKMILKLIKNVKEVMKKMNMNKTIMIIKK
jgi:hypothetical protein